jgi:hypothetical protein
MAQISEPLTFDSLKTKEVSGVYEVSIAPEQARRIARATMTTATNFRKLNDDQRMIQMIDAMKRDEWRWTDADPIRLHIHEQTGEIVASDGQHRLMAAAQARRRLRTLVLWGPEWIGGVHVDRNKPRSVAQFLTHEHDISNAAALVAMSRFELSRIIAYHRKTKTEFQRLTIRDEQLVAFTLTNLDALAWSLNRYHAASDRGFNSIGYAVALFEFRAVSHDMTQRFHDDMTDNELDPTDPLMALRKSVGSRYNATGRRVSRDWTMNNLVKAWNMRAGQQTVGNWRNAGDEILFPLGFKIPALEDVETEAGQGGTRVVS